MNDHGMLIKEISEQLKPILDHSEQAVYVYLDDHSKVCNTKFAELLGYASPADWAAVQGSFPEVFVDEKSQETLVSAFQDAMEGIVASAFDITWKKKSNEKV